MKIKMQPVLRVKFFDEKGFNEAIREQEMNLVNAKKYKDALATFKGCSNLNDVELFLKSATNFANSSMSAVAMNLENEYLTIQKYDDLNLVPYNKNLDAITEDYTNALKHQFTDHFTEKETADMIEIEKMLLKINSFDALIRQSIFINHSHNYTFNEKSYIITKQFSDRGL